MIQSAALKKFKFFSSFSDEDCARLAPLLYEQSYHAGAIIYSAGEMSEAWHLVNEGEVIITHQLNHETITLARLAPGYFFSESALLAPNHKHRTQAQAVSDTTVIKLSQANFAKLKSAQPALALAILEKISRVLSERLTENTMRLGIISAISRLVNDPALTKNLPALANEVLRVTLEAIPCRQTFLGVYSQTDPEHIKILAAIGISPKELPRSLPVDTDRFLSQLHRQDGEIIISATRYANEPKVFYAKRNLLARGIKVEEDNVGLIVLSDKDNGDFTTANSLVLQIIAGQIAFALEAAAEREQHAAHEELERRYVGF